MSDRIFAIVNPAAGGGRCGAEAEKALAPLRSAGLSVELAQTKAPGDATSLARNAFARGFRRFLSIGGDGTAFEIVNGIFPLASHIERPALAFLPLGTGNSFLKDFDYRGPQQTIDALLQQRKQSCDVIRLVHASGEFYFINLLTLGFAADAAAVANRHFKRLGEAGYLLAVFACLLRLNLRAFPLRADDDADFNRQPCLFLAFNNTRYTGGKMLIAPGASPTDGLIEFVRWGPIGRLGLLRNLPCLFDGSHVNHPLASRRAVRRVEFDLDGPVNITLDGESMFLQPRRIEILPSALDVFV